MDRPPDVRFRDGNGSLIDYAIRGDPSSGTVALAPGQHPTVEAHVAPAALLLIWWGRDDTGTLCSWPARDAVTVEFLMGDWPTAIFPASSVGIGEGQGQGRGPCGPGGGYQFFGDTSPPPEPPPSPLAWRIVVQPEIHAGEALRFTAFVRNTAASDYRFDGDPLIAGPCPEFRMALGTDGENREVAFERLRLPCDDVSTLAGGQEVAFQMELVVPPGTPRGLHRLFWDLLIFPPSLEKARGTPLLVLP